MAIWWIRRDSRLTDNLALQAALSAGGAFVPVFVLDTRLLAKPAERLPVCACWRFTSRPSSADTLAVRQKAAFWCNFPPS